MASSAALTAPVSQAPLAAGVTEGVAATRNALTLGATMLVGMAVSLLVRLAVVRALGPEAFGQFRFAEIAAEMVFVGLTLGVDTLLRREAALDPARAHGFLRAILLLRVVAGAVLVTLIAAALALLERGGAVVGLFLVLGAAQFLIVLNNSYTALEHATGRVAWVARVTLLFKLLWAALVLAAARWAPSAILFALALLAVEALRLVRLGARQARVGHGGPRPDLRTAGGAALQSLPFFVNFLAYSLYARVGVWWLGATSASQEVGWYGAASTLAALAMLGMPLISWVLVPASTRAARRDPEEAARLFEGALRLALLVAVPVSLAVGLAAPAWVRLLFGDAYLAAAPALQLLAPTFTLAYVATVGSIRLIQQDRVGALASVSVAGLVLSLALNAVLIPWGARVLGPGGGATGAAAATLLTEVAVTVALLGLGRFGPWSASLRRTVAGLALGAVGAAAAWAIQADPRLVGVLAAAAFVCGLLASRAVSPTDLDFFRSVLRRTKHDAPVSP